MLLVLNAIASGTFLAVITDLLPLKKSDERGWGTFLIVTSIAAIVLPVWTLAIWTWRRWYQHTSIIRIAEALAGFSAILLDLSGLFGKAEFIVFMPGIMLCIHACVPTRPAIDESRD